jgi:hypothetical protein
MTEVSGGLSASEEVMGRLYLVGNVVEYMAWKILAMSIAFSRFTRF